MRHALKFLAVFLVMFLMFSVASVVGTMLIMLLGKWSWTIGVALFAAVASYFAWTISAGSWRD